MRTKPRVRETFFEELAAPSPTPRGLKVLFASASVFVFMFELLAGPATTPQAGWQDIAWAFAICVASAASGFFPAQGGIAVASLLTFAYATEAEIAAPTMGLYLVLAYWVSKGWWGPAAAALLSAGGAEVAFTSMPVPTAAGILLGSTFSIVSGLLLRQYWSRIAAARAQAEESEAKARTAAQAVRQDLAASLHDSVVRDMVRVAMLSSAVGPGSADQEQWEAVERLSLNAMGKLREIAGVKVDSSDLGTQGVLAGNGDSAAARGPRRQPEPESLSEVVSECRRIVASGGMELNVVGLSPDSVPLGTVEHAAAAVALREACTNVLKYAQTGSKALLRVSLEDGVVSFVLTNLVGPDTPRASALSGKFGLKAVQVQAADSGGNANYWRAGDRFVFSLDLPALDGNVLEETLSSE